MALLAENLANWTLNLQFDDLPDVVVHQAKCRVLDSLGTMLGGWRSKPATIARELALEGGGPASVRDPGTGREPT